MNFSSVTGPRPSTRADGMPKKIQYNINRDEDTKFFPLKIELSFVRPDIIKSLKAGMRIPHFFYGSGSGSAEKKIPDPT